MRSGGLRTLGSRAGGDHTLPIRLEGVPRDPSSRGLSRLIVAPMDTRSSAATKILSPYDDCETASSYSGAPSGTTSTCR